MEPTSIHTFGRSSSSSDGGAAVFIVVRPSTYAFHSHRCLAAVELDPPSAPLRRELAVADSSRFQGKPRSIERSGARSIPFCVLRSRTSKFSSRNAQSPFSSSQGVFSGPKLERSLEQLIRWTPKEAVISLRSLWEKTTLGHRALSANERHDRESSRWENVCGEGLNAKLEGISFPSSSRIDGHLLAFGIRF